MQGAELESWILDRAREVFERAGEALDRRDITAHTACCEEHAMLSAMLIELDRGRTLN